MAIKTVVKWFKRDESVSLTLHVCDCVSLVTLKKIRDITLKKTISNFSKLALSYSKSRRN